MKNIIKKLGIFGLLLAVLIPFMELPVKAEEGNCETHLHNYMFMDLLYGPQNLGHYLGNGYNTFTSFHYSFPKLQSGQTINIESIIFNDLSDEVDMENFYKNYVELIGDRGKVLENLNVYGNFKDIKGESVTTSGVDKVTYLLHGKWSRVDENAQPADYSINSKLFDGESFEEFYKSTIQGAVISSDKGQFLNKFDVNLGGATLTSSGGNINMYKLDNYYSTKSYLIEYFNKIVLDVNTGNSDAPSWENGYVWRAEDTDYLNLSIKRSTTKEDFLDKLVFGSMTDNYVFSTSATTISNSYTAFKTWFDAVHESGTADSSKECTVVDSDGMTLKEGSVEGCYRLPKGDNKLTFDLNPNTEIYHPYVLGVKYKVCETATTTAQWTLTYDANTEDTNVTGTPETQTTDVGNELTIGNGPTRDEYKFVKWCLNKDGSGTCYQSGDKIKSTTATTVTLYAQWTQKGTTDNKDTGIETYLLTFVAVGVIASSVYLVVKKKNLFNQI